MPPSESSALTDLYYSLADIDYLLSDDSPGTDWATELADLERRLRHFRHERLVYLLLMLALAGFSLLAVFVLFLASAPEKSASATGPLLGLLTLLLLLLPPCTYRHFRLAQGIRALYQRACAVTWRLKGCPDPSRAFYARAPGEMATDKAPNA